MQKFLPQYLRHNNLGTGPKLLPGYPSPAGTSFKVTFPAAS